MSERKTKCIADMNQPSLDLIDRDQAIQTTKNRVNTESDQVASDPKTLPYEEGGHTELILEAQNSPNGHLLLHPEDLKDPNRVTKIHFEWRGVLEDGNSLDIASFGLTKVITPTPEVSIYEAKK